MSKLPKKSRGQEAAEAEVNRFREELGPFVTAAETTRMAMVFADATVPDHPIIFANDSFLALTLYSRAEVLGRSFNSFLAQDTGAETLALIAAGFGGCTVDGSEICYRRKDGSLFWAALFMSPVKDDEGNIVQFFASMVDLTPHKKAEALSKLLIDELNHRVKNTLVTVQAIVLQALRTSPDPAALRRNIESRLFALSRSHDLLTRENWKGAELRDVLAAALEPFVGLDGREGRIALAGESVRLAPRAALAFGIAFNELATNAVKYGALSGGKGTVRVDWSLKPSPRGRRLLLHWRECGGPPVVPPLHKGVGTRVLERGIAGEMGGTVDLDYRPSGLVCTMELAAPETRHD